jgi:hypothetical protein
VSITAKNNTVLVKPNYEVLRRLSTFHADGEVINHPIFGAVKMHASQDYVNTSPGNNIAWGTVMSVGAGAAWMAGKATLDQQLQPGDVIGFDVQHEVSTPFEGEKVFFLPVDQALCRFNPGDALPVPLGVYMLTVEEPGAAERVTFRDRKAGIVLPRNVATGALKVSDSPHSQIRFTVERVLSVGPGGMGHSEIRTEVSLHEEVREQVRVSGETMGSRVISSKVIEKRQTPVWIQPEATAVGQLALFLFTMSVDIMIRGVRHRITNWDRVRALVTDDAESATAEPTQAENDSYPEDAQPIRLLMVN